MSWAAFLGFIIVVACWSAHPLAGILATVLWIGVMDRLFSKP